MASQTIQDELEAAIRALTGTVGEDILRKIKPILLSNLDRGRVQYFIDGGTGSIPAYISLVIKTYTALNPLIHQLQRARDPETWQPLFERMQTWAYNFFLRKNFAADNTTQEIALECASNAAVTLLDAYFPYDTEFDPWAHIIVQNACRKFIANAFKKSALPEDKRVELDDDLVAPNDTLLEIHALQKETAGELERALNQLSEARRTVIRYIYFDEMKAEDVAEKMGKSVGAIYSLQFNALQDLRKILSRIRDSLNE